MSSGWWWTMIALLTLVLFAVLYFGVFLLWLARYGGAQGLKAELMKRLGKESDNGNQT